MNDSSLERKISEGRFVNAKPHPRVVAIWCLYISIDIDNGTASAQRIIEYLVAY